jgi:T-complex protein 1 subunit theta
MAFTHAGGMSSMLKEGAKQLSGLEEAVLKNIEACQQLSVMVRTSMGPNGMNKMVINHLERLFVTSDARTIVTELEVQHPAAKILALSANRQWTEVGDGSGLVIALGGELLHGAEALLHTGLHPSDVIDGYIQAAAKVSEILSGAHPVCPTPNHLPVNESPPARGMPLPSGTPLSGGCC